MTGYFLVDAAGVSKAAESAETVSGLYNQTYRGMKTNKPMWFENILSGEDGLYTPIPGACTISGTTITVDCGVVKFTITNADLVTIVNE
jgi:hypothetical protein